MAASDNNPLSLEPLNLFETLDGITSQIPVGAAPYQLLVHTNCQDTAEVEGDPVLYDAASGYCDGDSTAGTAWRQSSIYPFPRLYHRANDLQRELRENELAQAKLDNWFDDTLIPGAVVHGNVSSPNVRDNMLWTLRGSEEQRGQFAQEANLGVDDAEPGENAVELFEAIFPYFEKYWPLWVTNPNVLSNISRLMSLLVGNALDDGDPTQVKIGFVDHVLLMMPATRTQELKHWDFYPDFPERYPKPAYFDEFRDDDLIAWLQVASSSPYSRLQPYKEHQENFKVTNEHLRQTEAFRNDDLDQAMAEGRVFIVDFKAFNEFNLRPPARHGF